uniref:Uncharacterized protein n=1 Tax=Acanthochromis polyacanthus TaxID=80966 RepID=A0A3Q1GM12_9TELE
MGIKGLRYMKCVRKAKRAEQIVLELLADITPKTDACSTELSRISTGRSLRMKTSITTMTGWVC